MKWKGRRPQKILILTLLLLQWVPLARAEELEVFDMSFEELQRIRVSVASYQEEPELSTGSSVSSIDESQWQARSAKRVIDAIDHFPGIMTGYALGGTTVMFRGFSNRDAPRMFSVQIDGITLNDYSLGTTLLSTPDMFNLDTLEKIELIRGPGSHLYGTNAMSGVVALKSWTPRHDQISLDVGGGSFYYSQAALKYSKELVGGLRLSSVFSLRQQKNENTKYYYTGEDGILDGSSQTQARKYDNKSMIIKLHKDRFELGYYYSHYEAEDFMGFDPRPGAFENGNTTDFDPCSITILRAVNTFALPWHMELDTRLFYTENASNVIWSLQSGPVDRDGDNLARKVDETSCGTHLLLRGKDLAGLPLQWFAGYDFKHAQVDEAEQILQKDSDSQRTLLDYEGEQRQTHSIIFNLNYELFNDRIHLIAGGRWDSFSDVGDHFSPRLGVIGHPTTASAIKLLYNTSFRAPTIQERVGQLSLLGNPLLDPEEFTVYELIYIHYLKDGRFSLTFFLNNLKDPILQLPYDKEPGYTQSFFNTDDVKTRGVEVDCGWRIGRSTELSLNSTYMITNEGASTFPAIIINWGVEHRFRKVPLQVAFFNRHQLKAKDGNFDFPLEPNPVGKSSLGAYWRPDLHLEYLLGANRQQSIYLDIRNLFNRQQSRGSTVSIENGTPEPRISFVIGFRMTY